MSKGGGSGGTNASTTTATQQPNPQFAAAYGNLVDRANAVSNQPLQQYDQPLVAGFSPQQQQGFQTVQNIQGGYVPFLNAAAQEYGQGTQPIWSTLPSYDVSGLPQGGLDRIGQSSEFATKAGNTDIAGGVSPFAQSATTAAASVPSNISTFESPYTKNVTDALRGLFSQQNAEQLAQQRGSTVGAGAYGGDRQAVSEALLGKQQTLAQAPVLAQVQQQGYQAAVDAAQKQAQLMAQTGLGAGQLTGQSLAQQGQLGLGAGQLGLAGGHELLSDFAQQQQAQQAAETTNRWLAMQGGQGLAALGTQAQNLGLQGAAANITAGKTQQDLAQQQLNIPYQQFLQRQQYPYQQLNFLAPIVEGMGSLAGGTSSTTQPGPSTLSQLGGLGTTGVGLLGQTGAFGDNGYISNLFGPSSETMGANAAAETIAGLDPSSLFLSGGKYGGRVGLAAGGIPGEALDIDTHVPDVSVDMIPHLAGTGHSPLVSSLAAPPPTTTTTTTSGGGGGPTAGGVLGGLLGAAKLATFFLKDGGLAGTGDPAPLETQEPTVTPAQQLSAERYADMDENKLQQLAVQVPPNSPQAQQIQKAIARKRINPQQAPQKPDNLPSSYLPLQSKGLEGSSEGGSADSVDEADMDAHPIVDHSGPTVVIHYPSEGRSLDLGIPSSRGSDDGYDEGGKVASLKPLSTTFRPGTPNEPVNQTRYDQPGFSFLPAPGGVQLPAMYQPYLFGAPGQGGNPTAEPGGGLGQWFNPLPQINPPPAGPQASAIPAAPAATSPGSGNFAADVGPITAGLLSGGSFTGTPEEAQGWEKLKQDILAGRARDGGRVGLADGGGPSGLDLSPGIPQISLDYIHPPGPAVKGPRGSGLPKPPPASKGEEPPGLDPGKILKTIQGDTGSKEGLAKGEGAEGLAGGGAGPGTLDILSARDEDEDEPNARAALPPIATAKLPPQEASADLPPPPPPEVRRRPPDTGGAGPATRELLREHEAMPDPYARAVPGLAASRLGVEEAFKDKDLERHEYQPPFTPRPEGLGAAQPVPAATALIPPLPPEPPKETPKPRTPDLEETRAAPGTGPLPERKASERKPELAGPTAGTMTPPARADVVEPSAQMGPIARAITEKASAYGVNPQAALKFAQLESGMGQNLGTRGNIYQLGPNEWASMGGGNMGDLNTQVDRGLKYVAHDYDVARAKLGREPQDFEAYMVHQQGDAGGPALLTAPANASAVDVLTQAHGGNRQAAQQAIIQNAGDLSMTAQQFVEAQKARLEGYGGRLNLGASQLGLSPGGPDQVVRGPQPSTPVNSSGPSAAANIPIPQAQHYEPGMGASPWAALTAAGLGMMASRSPFPLQAIGEGGLQGMKVLQAQEAEKMRAAQLANEAANRQATLGLEKARLSQTELHQAQSLGVQQDDMERKAAQFAQTMNLDWAKLDRQAKADLVSAAYKDELAQLRRAQEERGTWQYGEGPDPSDPNKTVKGSWFMPTYGGEPRFEAGKGAARQTSTTGVERVLQAIIASGAAGDESVPYAERLTRAITISKNPQQSEQYIQSEARRLAELDQRAAAANLNMKFDPEAALRKHYTELRASMGQGAQQPQPQQQWTRDRPFQSKDPSDIANLPAGSIIRTPDGRLMEKP